MTSMEHNHRVVTHCSHWLRLVCKVNGEREFIKQHNNIRISVVKYRSRYRINAGGSVSIMTKKVINPYLDTQEQKVTKIIDKGGYSIKEINHIHYVGHFNIQEPLLYTLHQKQPLEGILEVDNGVILAFDEVVYKCAMIKGRFIKPFSLDNLIRSFTIMGCHNRVDVSYDSDLELHKTQ